MVFRTIANGKSFNQFTTFCRHLVPYATEKFRRQTAFQRAMLGAENSGFKLSNSPHISPGWILGSKNVCDRQLIAEAVEAKFKEEVSSPNPSNVVVSLWATNQRGSFEATYQFALRISEYNANVVSGKLDESITNYLIIKGGITDPRILRPLVVSIHDKALHEKALQHAESVPGYKEYCLQLSEHPRLAP